MPPCVCRFTCLRHPTPTTLDTLSPMAFSASPIFAPSYRAVCHNHSPSRHQPELTGRPDPSWRPASTRSGSDPRGGAISPSVRSLSRGRSRTSIASPRHGLTLSHILSLGTAIRPAARGPARGNDAPAPRRPGKDRTDRETAAKEIWVTMRSWRIARSGRGRLPSAAFASLPICGTLSSGTGNAPRTIERAVRSPRARPFPPPKVGGSQRSDDP